MNNRFLFRGKLYDDLLETQVVKENWNGQGWIKDKWMFVNIVCEADICEDYDTHVYWASVKPKTVSQCTGLVAGKSYRGESEFDRLIFEGDLLLDEGGEVWLVIYKPDFAGYRLLPQSDNLYLSRALNEFTSIYNKTKVEIIGNKWDNPELLEVENYDN